MNEDIRRLRLEHKAQVIQLIKVLKESRDISDKDMDIVTDPNDNNYYAGLSDGYDIAIKYIREYL